MSNVPAGSSPFSVLGVLFCCCGLSLICWSLLNSSSAVASPERDIIKQKQQLLKRYYVFTSSCVAWPPIYVERREISSAWRKLKAQLIFWFNAQKKEKSAEGISITATYINNILSILHKVSHLKKKKKKANFWYGINPQSCLVFFEDSNRTICKTSRLTRACHCPFNALSLRGVPLKDAPNLQSPSHCPGTETDWASSVVHRPVHFEHNKKLKKAQLSFY